MEGAVVSEAPDRDGGRVGRAIHAFVAELYPICRSITGDGVRRTLRLIQREVPLAIHEVPTGTRVFDWEVPPEWNIRRASVRDRHGRVLVDFADHNLHLVSYSEPVRATLDADDLRAHLHTLPDHPDWIPYRTSYYSRTWGFCLRHRDLGALADGPYDVLVDSSLARGSLTYGEAVITGTTRDEVLLFAHCCHPSLANDNTSGMAVATWLARWLASEPRRFTYRMVFAPGTIGSLCWLQRNERRLSRVRHGLVLALLGDPSALTYKQTPSGRAEIDDIARYVLAEPPRAGRVIPFEPYGYNERQLCSPGFDLPVGRLTRAVNGGYPEYHSSADDLALVTPERLAQSLEACRRIVDVIEGNGRYRNLSPKGEPRLGARGLYGSVGGREPKTRERAMLWTLSRSMGETSLLDIAVQSGLGFDAVRDAARDLERARLLRAVAAAPSAERAATRRPRPARRPRSRRTSRTKRSAR
jgi:aminopeptidase-like protein